MSESATTVEATQAESIVNGDLEEDEDEEDRTNYGLKEIRDFLKAKAFGESSSTTSLLKYSETLDGEQPDDRPFTDNLLGLSAPEMISEKDVPLNGWIGSASKGIPKTQISPPLKKPKSKTYPTFSAYKDPRIQRELVRSSTIIQGVPLWKAVVSQKDFRYLPNNGAYRQAKYSYKGALLSGSGVDCQNRVTQQQEPPTKSSPVPVEMDMPQMFDRSLSPYYLDGLTKLTMRPEPPTPILESNSTGSYPQSYYINPLQSANRIRQMVSRKPVVAQQTFKKVTRIGLTHQCSSPQEDMVVETGLASASPQRSRVDLTTKFAVPVAAAALEKPHQRGSFGPGRKRILRDLERMNRARELEKAEEPFADPLQVKLGVTNTIPSSAHKQTYQPFLRSRASATQRESSSKPVPSRMNSGAQSLKANSINFPELLTGQPMKLRIMTQRYL